MIWENIESPTPNNLYPNFDQNSHNWESELDIESDIEEPVSIVTDLENEQEIRTENEIVKVYHNPKNIKIPTNAKGLKISKSKAGKFSCTHGCMKTFFEYE